MCCPDHDPIAMKVLEIPLGLSLAAVPTQKCCHVSGGAVQGILSVLNAFSGSVFLTVGVTHLLPDVLEYQDVALPNLDFPLGLSIIVLGFMLILFVEQVLFDMHGSTVNEKTLAARAGAKHYSMLDRTLTVWRKFSEPLLTEMALGVHEVLESIVLGLAVRSAPLSFTATITGLSRLFVGDETRKQQTGIPKCAALVRITLLTCSTESADTQSESNPLMCVCVFT